MLTSDIVDSSFVTILRWSQILQRPRQFLKLHVWFVPGHGMILPTCTCTLLLEKLWLNIAPQAEKVALAFLLHSE